MPNSSKKADVSPKRPRPIPPEGDCRAADDSGADTPDRKPEPAGKPAEKPDDSQNASPGPAVEKKRHEPFARAAREDDDGYDPWSDRPASKPFWEEDPWR